MNTASASLPPWSLKLRDLAATLDHERTEKIAGRDFTLEIWRGQPVAILLSAAAK